MNSILPENNTTATHTFKKKKHYGLLVWLWVADIFLMAAVYLASYAIRFAPGMPIIRGVPPFHWYLRVLPFTLLVYFLVLRFYGLYRLDRLNSQLEEFFLILKSVLMGSVILMASSFVYRQYSYSRVMLVITSVLLVFVLFINHVLFHRLGAKLARARGYQRNILLAGHGPSMRHLIQGFAKLRKGSCAIVGLLSTEPEHVGTHVNEVTVIGTLDDFERVLDENPVDEVILGEMSVSRKRILEMILKCEEKMAHFKMISDLLGSMTTKLDVENMNGVSLLSIKESPLNHPVNRFVKRFMDILISLAVLIVFSPLMLLITVLIKLTDRGPILYRQERVGEDGKIFFIYKFRSMAVDAESKTGPQFAEEDDPRRTPLGSFLRQINLDELPQLFNVLKGDMSLVGPRPERPVFVDQLKTDIPRYMSRHRVRSGITGWAQINGLRGGPPSEERIKYDLYYIENWSVRLDFKILLMTPFSFKNAR